MNANVEVLLSDDERQPVECWTRVMGYFRPVSHFNKGKKANMQNVFGSRKAKLSLIIPLAAAWHPNKVIFS